MPSGVYVKSKAHRQKIGAALRGRKTGTPSKETRRKISEALKRSERHRQHSREMTGVSRPAHVRQKISLTRRQKKLSFYPSPEVAKLATYLKTEWIQEAYIYLGNRGRGFSGVWVDLAHPILKWVIEVDGKDHQRSQLKRERDIRRDKTLNECGWRVIRINKEDIP